MFLWQGMASETNGCPVFDSDGNLYLFGTRGDFSVSSDLGRATRIKATDQRPTFETKNLQCMSSYNLKTVYFLNADDSGNKLYYYDFKAQRYGFVELTGQGPDMATVQAIIDYDTLVIYAYAKGEMKRLGDAQDLNLSKQPSSLPWIQANKNVVPPNFNPEYVATLTHAHFNLFFYGVPNTRDGQVWAFRIHFGEFGPEPTSLNSNFKTIKGQAATFQFKYPEQSEHGGAPAHVAFIPDE